MDQPPRSGPHPIVWILVGIAVLPCLLCGFCVIGAGGGSGSPPSPTDISPVGRSNELHLQVTSAELKTNRKGKRVVAGTLMNTSGKKYSQVAITYRMYDKNGNRLGETKAFLKNVPSGKPVPFEADISYPLVNGFTFQGIEAR